MEVGYNGSWGWMFGLGGSKGGSGGGMRRLMEGFLGGGEV